MPPAGFEPAIPAIEPPLTYTLDHTATEIGDDSCHQGKVLEREITCNVKKCRTLLNNNSEDIVRQTSRKTSQRKVSREVILTS